MLSEVFYWILNMSVTASIMGLVILVLGKVQMIPKRIIYVLWLIPFLRMIVPVGVSSKMSLLTLISEFATRTVNVHNGAVELTMTNSIMAADSYFPIVYKTEQLKAIFSVASVVWVVIVIALVITTIIVYSTSKAEIKNALHIRDNVYCSDRITSPVTYGIINPVIVLPKLYNNSDLKHIIAHENAHIKRKDNLLRLVTVIIVCVHWFNPLSYVFLKSFLLNVELSCDEIVMKNYTQEEKKAYALSLLSCAENKNLLSSAFSSTKTAARIERILSYKKLSILATAFFVIFAVALGYVLLTNAK